MAHDERMKTNNPNIKARAGPTADARRQAQSKRMQDNPHVRGRKLSEKEKERISKQSEGNQHMQNYHAKRKASGVPYMKAGHGPAEKGRLMREETAKLEATDLSYRKTGRSREAKMEKE